MKRALITLAIGLLSTQAHANHKVHRAGLTHRHTWAATHSPSKRVAAHFSTARPSDCYGIPWCGCWLAHHLGIARHAKGLNLYLARNWTRWGHHADGPAPNVVGVLPHHVFLVLRVVGPNRVLAISGNDGHAVRTRVRSTNGVIAWRQA